MNKTCKFDTKWFKLQFGRRPTPKTTYEISQEIDDIEYKLSLLKETLFLLQLWTAKEDSALKTFVKTVSDLK